MNSKERILCACRVCGNAGISYLCDTFNEHSQTTVLSHYKCSHCGSVFVGNDVDGDELGIAYSTLDSGAYYAEIESENRKKMATAIRHLQTLGDRDTAIIDIGAGNGLFTELLHKAGFGNVSAHEIQGSDLSKIAGIARHIYQDFDYSTIPSGQFEAVTLMDVAEHVLNPGYLFKTCCRILKTDGIVYIHTPVVTWTDRFMHMLLRFPGLKKIGKIWQRGRTSIFHLQNYTPKSLKLTLEAAGFHDVRVDVKNELSWPLTRYVRTYLLEKQGLPGFLAPLFAPFFYPLLATDTFNANKAIVSARKAR